jgi:hypothetical protein
MANLDGGVAAGLIYQSGQSFLKCISMIYSCRTLIKNNQPFHEKRLFQGWIQMLTLGG